MCGGRAGEHANEQAGWQADNRVGVSTFYMWCGGRGTRRTQGGGRDIEGKQSKEQGVEHEEEEEEEDVEKKEVEEEEEEEKGKGK